MQNMAGERPGYGQLVSAFGAVVLAVAVFLPWYGVSFTANGLSFAQQVGGQVASQYGNATLKGYMSSLHTRLAGYVGHEFISLSAHQALKTLNVVLLIVAGIGCVVALSRSPARPSAGQPRCQLALLGAVAAACVLSACSTPRTPPADCSRCRCARARDWR